MNKNKTLKKYRSRYSHANHWPLNAGSYGDIDTVIVIPILAESMYIMATLSSIAENPSEDLERTLVVCVVNNKRCGYERDSNIEDNQRTLSLLRGIRKGVLYLPEGKYSGGAEQYLNIIKRGLRIAWIDASSPGRELPENKGGVGLARKIGFDNALEILVGSRADMKIIISLDADTLVGPHYISSIKVLFRKKDASVGVIPFVHQRGHSPSEQAAIETYESYLRHYVLGLRYAGSPYAHHSIGSTMVFTPDAYVAVRGMNMRSAGEDFYFLNKLAKIYSIEKIKGTEVYPSSRPSARVPFGTGKSVSRLLDDGSGDSLFYDPNVFRVLKAWLELMGSAEAHGASLAVKAGDIHPCLMDFLQQRGLDEVLGKLLHISSDSGSLTRHMHTWFDGFMTLKLMNHLTREVWPRISAGSALSRLLEIIDGEPSARISTLLERNGHGSADVLRILRELDIKA